MTSPLAIKLDRYLFQSPGLQAAIDRYEEFQRLKKVAAIVQAHPEWLEEEPELKKLLKT